MLTTSLAACSSGPEGVVVNLYGGASGLGFDKIIADCNEQAAGRYTIVGNLLPSDADGQRDQFVRRLAAQDTGMDLLGMDVTWTAEFAEAGWIQELTGHRAARLPRTRCAADRTATWKGKLYGIPRTTNVQLMWYRKSLVPNPPKTFDEMMQKSQPLKDQGKPYEIGFTAAQYEGYVVNVNNLIKGYGGAWSTTTARPRRSTTRPWRHSPCSTGWQLRPGQPFAVQRAGAGGVRGPAAGRSAFSLNWPYVLSAMRNSNPQLVADLGFAPYPTVESGRRPPRPWAG